MARFRPQYFPQRSRRSESADGYHLPQVPRGVIGRAVVGASFDSQAALDDEQPLTLPRHADHNHSHPLFNVSTTNNHTHNQTHTIPRAEH